MWLPAVDSDTWIDLLLLSTLTLLVDKPTLLLSLEVGSAFVRSSSLRRSDPEKKSKQQMLVSQPPQLFLLTAEDWLLPLVEDRLFSLIRIITSRWSSRMTLSLTPKVTKCSNSARRAKFSWGERS